MKKPLLSIFLVLCMLFISMPTTVMANNETATTLQEAGTKENPYKIANENQLFAFADIVNGTNGAIQNTTACALVVANIDITNRNWTPIGSQAAPYSGTFDCKNDVTISSPYINRSKPNNANQIGFFGYIEDATITNVHLKNVMVSGDTDVGGIAGVAINSTISNCSVSGEPNSAYSSEVRGSESVGGIVGRIEDSYIKNCINDAAVYLLITDTEPARHKLGGIAGVATLSDKITSAEDAILISDCTNNGKITCTTANNYECTGGIVGRLISNNATYRAVIRNCNNTGEVSSIESGTGGIVGYAQNASIESCKNTAKITGTNGIGGIAGYAYYGTQILLCQNSGEVIGLKDSNGTQTVYPYNIGGIVGSIYNPKDPSYQEGSCNNNLPYGYNKDSLIKDCTNSGAITCENNYPEIIPEIRFDNNQPIAINIYGSFTGGIAGFAADSAYFEEEGNSIRIENCQNTGMITGSTYTGGVIGIFKNVALTQCANSGTVTNSEMSNTDTIKNDIGGYSFTVWFNANGGTTESSDALALAISGKLETLPTPTRSDYTFTGWFTEPSGGEKITEDTLFTGRTTVYAHWSKNSSGTSSEKTSSGYPILIKDTNYGIVTVSPKYANKGNTVNLTITPDPGYTLKRLLLVDKNKNNLESINQGNGIYTFTMPASSVTVTATFMEDNTLLNFFVDVPTDSYYYQAILWATQNNITGGVDALHFAPDTACTRGQIITFLWRAAGRPEPTTVSKFLDVSADAYYAKAVAWAVEQGITSGTSDDKFSPDTTCTRAQAVSFLYRYFGRPVVNSKVTFTDVPNNAYYTNAVAWAQSNNITKGIGNNLFGSNYFCTRGQIISFLHSALASEQ